MRERRVVQAAALAALTGLAALGLWAGSPAASRAGQDRSIQAEIVFPPDGAEVAGPGVPVQWRVLARAGDGRTLHVDLVVDGGAARIDRAANPAVVPGLEPGEHTVELVVEDEDDRPVDAGEGPSVTVTVLYPMPVRLQSGACDDLDEDPVAFLSDVESRFRAGDDENAADDLPPLPPGADGFNPVEVSETRLELPLAVILGEEHALAVYAPGAALDDETEEDELIACGEIGGPTYGGDLRVALRPANGSEAFGMALLRDEDRRTRIRIEFYRADVEPVATPAPTASPSPSPTATETATATETPFVPPPTEVPFVPPPTVPPPVPTVPPPPPPAPTNTPVAPVPTETPVPPPPTDTPAPPVPPDTPVPPPPTDTPVPPPPTDTPAPPPPPATETPVPPP